MIDKEYQKYIEDQSLGELKKIALRINKLHFPDEFSAVVKRIAELEGDKFDRDFYLNPDMKDALHLEIKGNVNKESRINKSKKILTFFLITFSIILSINVYNFLINQNYLSVIPICLYIVLIGLNISQHKLFGKACKIWALCVMFFTLLLNFKDLIGFRNEFFINILNSLIGSNEIIQPSVILMAASILIYIYADHIIIADKTSEDY